MKGHPFWWPCYLKEAPQTGFEPVTRRLTVSLPQKHRPIDSEQPLKAVHTATNLEARESYPLIAEQGQLVIASGDSIAQEKMHYNSHAYLFQAILPTEVKTHLTMVPSYIPAPLLSPAG